MLIWTSRNIPNVGLFSAYAEVFLCALRSGMDLTPFLCLRRGVSGELELHEVKGSFSLPTQRCFDDFTVMGWNVKLFSAYAEVFPVRAL